MNTPLKEEFKPQPPPSILADPSSKEEQTRHKIASATFELFAQYGIRSISMDEVARNLGMSKRTLYEHFADKEDLLVACIESNSQSVRELFTLLELTSETVLHVVLGVYRELLPRLKHYSTKFHSEISRYPRACKLLNDRRDEQTHNLEHFFQRGVSQGVFLPQINYQIIARAFTFQIDQALDSPILRDFTLVEIHNSLMFTMLRGSCTDYGIRVFEQFSFDKQ